MFGNTLKIYSQTFCEWNTSQRGLFPLLHINLLWTLPHHGHRPSSPSQLGEVGEGIWRSEKLKTSWQRTTQPSQALKVFEKNCSDVYHWLPVDKGWSPGVSALTRPFTEQRRKHKPACACHFISWLVRACFLCISLNMAFYPRDFATSTPPPHPPQRSPQPLHLHFWVPAANNLFLRHSE